MESNTPRRATDRPTLSPPTLPQHRPTPLPPPHQPTMSIIQQVSNATLNDNWRTVNIDLLDPESSSNFDTSTLHAPFAPVSDSEIHTLGQQVRQLLRGGDAEGALRGALEGAPYGGSDSVKDFHLQTVTEVLQGIRQIEMTPMLERIFRSEGGPEALDVLMKYLYVIRSPRRVDCSRGSADWDPQV